MACCGPAAGQQSTATSGGITYTLRSEPAVSGSAVTATAGGSTYTFVPQTVADPFAGRSTAPGGWTLLSGGAAQFYSDRFDDFTIWARGEFANPALASSQPAADKDGDGFSNEFEWLSLTDPEDASSRLRLEISLLSATQFRLTLEPYFPAERNYELLGSTTMTTGTFSVFDTDLGAAAGSPPRATQDVNHNAAEPRRFFKTRITVKP